MAEEEQRRAVVVAARVAGDLHPCASNWSIVSGASAAARLDAVSIVARQRPKRMREFQRGRPASWTHNLKAFCQRCHMLHDRKEHRRQRRFAFQRRNALGDLFLGPYSDFS